MLVEYELVFTTLRFTARCESCDGTIAFGVADPSETLLSGVAYVGWRRGCASANHVAKYDVDPDEWVIAGEGPRVDAATRRVGAACLTRRGPRCAVRGRKARRCEPFLCCPA